MQTLHNLRDSYWQNINASYATNCWCCKDRNVNWSEEFKSWLKLAEHGKLKQRLTNEAKMASYSDFMFQCCRKLMDGLKCIDEFTTTCLDEDHRAYFNTLYTGTTHVIMDLCETGDYQTGQTRLMTRDDTCNLKCFDTWNLKCFVQSIWSTLSVWDTPRQNTSRVLTCISWESKHWTRWQAIIIRS